ncbi:MAG TPA: CopD family protein [Stellaceae bacterium]|nr:CopD family protein [Stellaceae bacterium]
MEPLLVAARTVHFAATIALAGVFAFQCLIAGPVFAQSAALAATSRHFARRLDRLAWASLALALLSGTAWLLGVAANVSGRPLAAVLAQGIWKIVLSRTQFGEDWLLRGGCAAAIALCLVLGRRTAIVQITRWMALGCAGLLLAALAWAGHGAATPGAPGDLHLAADMLHLLGAGGWLGTLLPFALLLAEARHGRGPDWALVAGRAARRYTMLAAASVTLLLVGGIVNTWFLAGTAPALIGTEYGRLLLLKIGLFLGTLVIAAVNLRRLSPRLAAGAESAAWRAALWLRRNALAEAGLGLAVVAIVGVLGILTPGLHSEPGWPLPVRVDVAALTAGARTLLLLLILAAALCAVAMVATAAAGSYRRAALFAGAVALCLAAGWLPLRAAVTPAYPTSFYAPAEPYAVDSVVRGAALYRANCALCHGADGRGDGPAAATLTVRPANLTEPHLLAHSPGDLFWWVSRGRAGGAMPGFAAVLRPEQRWDVINFIRARAVGAQMRAVGPEVSGGAAYPIPDFAFERGAIQTTLSRTLRQGPVLLVLFAGPGPLTRLVQLANWRLNELPVIAVEIDPAEAATPPYSVTVSRDVAAALALFRLPGDGEETELLLDRGGNVRARWIAGGDGGLPDRASLLAEAQEVARLAVAAPSHAGHAH